MYNIIPGINVRNALKSIGSRVGFAPKRDYDILDNYSVRGGARSPYDSNFIGKQNPPTRDSATEGEDTPADEQTNPDTSNNNNNTGSYGTGTRTGTGGNTSSATSNDTPFDPTAAEQAAKRAEAERVAAERARYRADQGAYYSDQIMNLNRLLGRIDMQQATGSRNIGTQYGTQKTDLTTRKERDMNAYGEQETENVQDRESGINSVDSFVNTSFSNLMRLLGGANAGNSSVARIVVPTLVSNAGGERRRGVMDTYSENDQAIDSARIDAENQYTDSFGDLDKWKEEQEYNLLTKAEQEKLGILDERKGLETAVGQLDNDEYLQNLIDSGQVRSGYQEAKAAGAGTQGEIDARMAELDKLFGNYNPTYAPRTIATKKPELSRYSLNSAQIEQGNTPGESLPYLPMLKRRKELV